jgi:hypothetical protein
MARWLRTGTCRCGMCACVSAVTALSWALGARFGLPPHSVQRERKTACGWLHVRVHPRTCCVAACAWRSAPAVASSLRNYSPGVSHGHGARADLRVAMQEVGKFIVTHTKVGQYRETFEGNFINGNRLLKLKCNHLPQVSACSADASKFPTASHAPRPCQRAGCMSVLVSACSPPPPAPPRPRVCATFHSWVCSGMTT